LLQEERDCSRRKGTAPGGRGQLQEEGDCSRRKGALGGRVLVQEKGACSRRKGIAPEGMKLLLRGRDKRGFL